MRIYLACTVRGDRGAVAAARAVCTRLQEHGHEVLTVHLLEDGVDEAEGRLTPQEVFRRDLDWLAGCDVLVAEASGSSYGVGFEVGFLLGRAERTGQRVVVVYDGARASRVSRLVSGNDHPRCTTLAYRDLSELLALVDRCFGPSPGGSIQNA